MANIQDLGTLEGDILVFGGPYSNLEATKALFSRADALGIPPERMICTGDINAYGGNPLETLDLIRARGVPVVAGNCEKQLGAGGEDCGCGFDEGSVCAELSKGWYAHARSQIDADARAWLLDRPDRLVFRNRGMRHVVIHGGAWDVSRFLWPVSSDDDFWHEIARLQEEIGAIDCVLAGHCGIPFQRNVDGVHWINAGVIGMPANDGQPETAFALLTDSGTVIEALSYDVDAAQHAMVAAGLTQGYEVALKTGYWPSEEVLPRIMRRR